MSTQAAGIAEAFGHLQAGDADAALQASRRVLRTYPASARAHLAAGLALRMLGRDEESRGEIATAARLDPGDYGAAYEHGVALAMQGAADAATPWFARAAALRPTFAPARHALGWSLHRARRVAEALPHLQAAAEQQPQRAWVLDLAQALWELRRFDEAGAQFRRAMELWPEDPEAHVAYGRFCVSRGEFALAADAFRAGLHMAPGRGDWSMYLAQAELLRGRWAAGWEAYRRREPRLRFESRLANLGRRYRVPPLAALRGQRVTVLAEQGLGDELFFLRFAAPLREAGARLSYAGEARLAPLLRRTHGFESVDEADPSTAAPPDPVLLSGDLPEAARLAEPFPPSLAVAPLPAPLERVRALLEKAGPRPWIGVTWRAGTPRELVAEALYKQVPLEPLMAAVGRLSGTLVAFQRGLRDGELAAAQKAAGRTVHDFSQVSEDLELALAATTLLDRHIGVSNTNMHLAAAAGAVADVLVPFPPEWRWRAEGDSPWFPGFRIHRQAMDLDWRTALENLALSDAAGNTSRG